MGPTGQLRILQIHPTRRCNLRCLHCYSSSAPEESGALDVALLRQAISDAAAEGYHVASFSGGEPLLYEPLRELLSHAKSLGMGTTVTTNGMLLKGRRLEQLEGVTDLIAISLDGKPDSHNRIRAHRRAFEGMAENLPNLRATGIPLGFIFTLTQFNLDQAEWVADFALEQGARLLQIHPLEETGRAAQQLAGEKPDGLESSVAFLEADRLQQRVGDAMKVQLDLSHRAALRHSPESVYGVIPAGAEMLPLADLVSPLVIEADATVVPLQYGFSRAFAIGNLQNQPLETLARKWKQEKLPAFYDLCARVFRDSTAETAKDSSGSSCQTSCQTAADKAPETGDPLGSFPTQVFNWYEAVTEASQEAIA